jgi:hypothetical protein
LGQVFRFKLGSFAVVKKFVVHCNDTQHSEHLCDAQHNVKFNAAFLLLC